MTSEDGKGGLIAPPKELHEYDELKFKTSMGINANVIRQENQGETAKRANGALHDIGEFIQGENTGVLRDLAYCGSIAVHIYLAPSLGQLVCVSQTQTLVRTPMHVANSAIRQLEGDVLEHYGKPRPRKRSGI